MNLGLKDKVVVITGGASGIGLAMAEGFLEEHALVAIVDRDTNKLLEVEKEFRSKGLNILSICSDIVNPDEVENAIKKVVSEWGRIDCLINNAGVNDGIGLNDRPEAFLESLKRNLYHYFSMAHFALPFLIKNKGNIINIASKTAITGQGNTSGYAASKGGILSLTREWAVSLLKFEIRVNAIVPAEVSTPQYEKWISGFDYPDEKLKEITARIPFGKRMTTPKEIADMAVFISSQCASHMTGQHIYVDGGYTHLDRAL